MNLKKLKKILIITLALIFSSGLISVFSKPQKAYAVIEASDIHIKTEASNDNGATWHNYSGSDNPGGVTVTANPGDTVKIKIKIWNTNGADNAFDVTGTGSLTNTQYIASVPESGINPDADINGINYTSYFFIGGVGGAVSQVNHSGSETSGYESLEVSLVLSDNFPIGQTEIVGEVIITQIGVGKVGFNPFNFIGKAQANGMIYSTFRIVVNNNPESLAPVGMPMTIYLVFFGIILTLFSLHIVRRIILRKVKY